jgi:uroporphyrinogen decarboxylase
MAESVKVLPDNIQKIIVVREWDMRTREGVQRFRELKAKSLPSVALDGELMYESIIPMQEELIDEIQRRYKEKNSHD